MTLNVSFIIYHCYIYVLFMNEEIDKVFLSRLYLININVNHDNLFDSLILCIFVVKFTMKFFKLSKEIFSCQK
jgi:hypothetical protein